MITQYSRVQLTLSEKEKEYAWFPMQRRSFGLDAMISR